MSSQPIRVLICQYSPETFTEEQNIVVVREPTVGEVMIQVEIHVRITTEGRTVL